MEKENPLIPKIPNSVEVTGRGTAGTVIVYSMDSVFLFVTCVKADTRITSIKQVDGELGATGTTQRRRWADWGQGGRRQLLQKGRALEEEKEK